MDRSEPSADSRVKKEVILFVALVGGSILFLPLAIYLVGKAVFGDYGGGDFFDFYANLVRGLFAGELTIGFLLLSPYLLWQSLRLTFLLSRRLAPKG